MAEIPVERKTGGGLPWWLIPLLLLLLLIPLFFLLRGCAPTPVATNTNTNGNVNRAVTTTTNTVVTNTAAVTTTNLNANNATSAGAAITDVGIFGTTTDKNSLVGRQVNLNAVKVTRVLSDRVFTVGTGAGETFALLSEALDSPGGKEKQIRMRSGQTVNIAGDFRRVPDQEVKEETAAKKDGSLSSKEYAEMKGQQVYLHTTKVEDTK